MRPDIARHRRRGVEVNFRGQDIFARNIRMKNNNVRILHDILLEKKYFPVFFGGEGKGVTAPTVPRLLPLRISYVYVARETFNDGSNQVVQKD